MNDAAQERTYCNAQKRHTCRQARRRRRTGQLGGQRAFFSSGTCTPTTVKAISCRASASISAKARSSPCSAATAPARPRRCAHCPGRSTGAEARRNLARPQAAAHMKSHEAARHGIGLVPEDRRIIQGLTVEENLQLAQIAPPIGWSIERIYELFPRLGERRKQEGTTLSGGEQQMLAIGRALARDVKLLLLDEPYEGLAPVIVQEIEKHAGADQEARHDNDHRRAKRHRGAALGRPRDHPRHGPGRLRRHGARGARQRGPAPAILGDLIEPRGASAKPCRIRAYHWQRIQPFGERYDR